jgi:hypothetical protein
LGVHIDDLLKWNVHVDFIYKKIIKFTSLFYKLRNLLPHACLSKLYFAFVHSQLCYGIEIYANACKSVTDKLYKLNNKLLRIILNKKLDTPVKELYQEQNTLPITLLHDFSILVLIFKCYYYKNQVPEIFQQYFITNNTLHYHYTRNNDNLFVKPFTSSWGKRSLLYHGSNLWNKLPTNVKQFSSVETFKISLKKYLFENYC